MTDSTDPDATELGDQDATEPSPSGGGYTEYEGAAASASTGFDKARTLAEKAASESGRLLKKRFVLEDELGRGGMGIVYKARDLRKVEAEDSNPYIAAKVLGQSFKEHPHAFVALQQEAVKSQKLAHPNVVTVHDFDREGNTIFMTMELLKGDPLDNLLKLEAPFSKEVSVRYFNEMCAGLEYAHKRGLIHSDFKPGNVFVTTGGTVKLLDFGIARAANIDSNNDFDAGELGALTPAYATVEMLGREPPSFSDDIYALACVFYYMLTGKHPYNGVSAADAQEQNLTPDRPRGLDNREWAALARGLSTKKSERFSTVEEFREAFSPPARSINIKAIAAVVVVMAAAAGWLAYQQMQAASGQEQLLAARIDDAQRCMIQRDYACAIDNARVVLSLSAGHEEAAQLLQLAEQARAEQQQAGQLDEILRSAGNCLESSDYACVRVRVEEALALDPDNAQAAVLMARAEQGEREALAAVYVVRAEACLDNADVDCARQVLTEAVVQGVAEAQLYTVSRRADELDTRLAMERKTRQAALTGLVSEGQACLEGGRLDCAEARASEVLRQEAGNPGAIALKEAVAAQRAQQARNAELAAGLLREARDCFERRDYSCAIAKADSALALEPGSSAANDLKGRSEKAQGSVKKSITIK